MWKSEVSGAFSWQGAIGSSQGHSCRPVAVHSRQPVTPRDAAAGDDGAALSFGGRPPFRRRNLEPRAPGSYGMYEGGRISGRAAQYRLPTSPPPSSRPDESQFASSGGSSGWGGSCPAELPAFQDATIPGAGVLCLTISRRASLLLPPTGGQRCRCPIRRLCESPTLEYDSSGGAHPCATSSLTDDQRGATPLARFGQLPPSWLCRRDPRDCSLIAAESTELRIPSLDSLRDKSVSALPSVERGASEVKPAVPGWARGRSRGWRGASRLWKKKTQGGKKLEAGDGDDAGYHRTHSTAKRPGLEQVGRWSTPGGQGHTLRSCTPSSAGPRNQATGDRGCGVVICTVCTSGIAGSRRPPGSRLCDGSSNFFFPNSGGRCHLFPRRILPLSRSHGRSVARTRDKLPAPRPHLCNPRAPDLVSPGLRPVFPAPLVVDPSCRKDTRA